MVDPQRLRRLLAMLDGYRGRLLSLRALPVEAYLDSEAFAGRYLVQAAAQTCIDVANHVIRLVHEFLQDRLVDLESFAAAVARMVSEPGVGDP